ncbi:hypothetical protein [Flavisphingomonas formosensis]|uniref:hypothetical protein n=1 Tax=Flavisphingomonas formosensis TaxID=861534 RepID=UPI001E3ECE8A|nr:hypothetical protein [Sphingomonas formosensis]
MATYEQKKTGSIGAGIIVAAILILAVIAAFAFGLIDVDQTKKAELPEVSVQGGQAPAFDVKTADVDVGTKTETVDVPKVEVKSKKTDVEVPTVDVKKAD